MTLYEKRGRRYVPVRETVRYDSFPMGSYLLRVSAGSTQITPIDLEPDRPQFAALADEMRDAMAEAMSEANRTELAVPEPLTPEQQNAAAKFRAAMGGGMIVFRGVSMRDVVDAGIAVLKGKLKGDD